MHEVREGWHVPGAEYEAVGLTLHVAEPFQPNYRETAKVARKCTHPICPPSVSTCLPMATEGIVRYKVQI